MPDIGRRAVLAIWAFALLAGCSRTSSWRLVEVADAYPRLAFRMENASTGRPVTAADFRGQAVVMVFGYTSCPDVCPTRLLTITSALKRVYSLAGRVSVLFVTVDPERDTRQVVAQYVSNFSSRTIGLRGSANDLAALARRYRVAYNVIPATKTSDYVVNHSATVYVFDAQGQLRLLAPDGASPDAFAHDLRQLAQEATSA